MASNSFIPSYMQTKEEDIEEEEKEIFLSTVSPSSVEIKEEETLEKETDVSSILPSYIKNSPIETDEDVEKVSFKERSAFGWEQEQQI